MLRIIGLLAGCLLAGCATTDKTFFANGNRGYRISCELSMADDLSHCYDAAGKICGRRGYQLYDWQGRILPWNDDDQYATAFAAFGPMTILVACNS